MKSIDELIWKEIKHNQIKGAQLGVYQNGLPVFEHAYGYPAETIYRLYSLSKPVAAVAAMLLVEQGKLDLLSPVSEFLEEFQEMKVWTPKGLVALERPVRVRELLNMTAGIVYPDEDGPGRFMQEAFDDIQRRADTEEGYSTREVMSIIAGQPLAFQPGENFRYGLCADVLGGVIEVITGQKLSAFYQENIFDKLDMEDTGFFVPRGKQKRLAELYCKKETPEGTVLLPDGNRHLGLGYGLVPPAFESAGAGLYATLEDYSHFANMLAAKGVYKNRRILSEKTVEMLGVNQLGERQRQELCKSFIHLRGFGYGNLMRIHMEPGISGMNAPAGEFGWDGWSGPYCSIDLASQQVVLYMTQISAYSGWELLGKIKNIVADGKKNSCKYSDFEQNE
ncbi:MAG: serine hydrolase domain-containing protein [Clostridiales bacterium]|nr:beta-lactamase family protein [Clostridiales bacterium]MDU3241554.1 serine hydrolase domain-containing protein [Clostridiales bacterium]